MFVSGMIAKGPMGWPGISYISAGVAFASCVLWFVLSANNATESRFIGETERHYIESSLKHGMNYHQAVIPIPWKAIWTSVPFLALLVTICSSTWGLSTLQAEIPAYMNGVLQMDIKDNAQNTIDLSPNHAGILMAITNTAANVVPIITPLLVGLIVIDNGNRNQWQIVFIISSVVFFVGNCIFLAFGTTVSQPWDAEDYLMSPQSELALPSTLNEKPKAKEIDQ